MRAEKMPPIGEPHHHPMRASNPSSPMTKISDMAQIGVHLFHPPKTMTAAPNPVGRPREPAGAMKVVCVSWEPELAKTRELLLRQAGYQVTTVLGQRDLSKLHQVTSADLLILAHSVPREEKLQALTVFRRNCSAPVLSLLRPHQSPLPEVDYAVEAFEPREFLDAVARATSRSRKRRNVGCRNCDLIFEVSEHLVASHERQDTMKLQCPYCGSTGDYSLRELLRNSDTSEES